MTGWGKVLGDFNRQRAHWENRSTTQQQKDNSYKHTQNTLRYGVGTAGKQQKESGEVKTGNNIKRKNLYTETDLTRCRKTLGKLD